MKLDEAKDKLLSLKDQEKYVAMVQTAGVITSLLETKGVKPIVVGGLSVDIYTQNDYATRDIDFVADGFQVITEILLDVGFEKDGRHFYHREIEVAVEFPDNFLAGDPDKVVRLQISPDTYINIISIEDIIMDRLRSHCLNNNEEDEIWGFRLLLANISRLDVDYMFRTCEVAKESNVLSQWLAKLEEAPVAAGEE
ncbi:nucleotidyltransferase [Cytobacillus gottheilii]|uniref:nucleotidyltransferase n=1 Tax=Cytobacillus gottheilii TaxID=859144 RepID=UPI0009BC249B|nr:nucleotidyltransferase [Cytobacillus gottheilii]